MNEVYEKMLASAGRGVKNIGMKRLGVYGTGVKKYLGNYTTPVKHQVGKYA